MRNTAIILILLIGSFIIADEITILPGTRTIPGGSVGASSITLSDTFTWTGPHTFSGLVIKTVTPVTIADNGNGGTAATSTLTTPLTAKYRYTCSDAQGCNLTLGETSVNDGQDLCITNAGTNTLNIADTSGVSETAGAFAMGQYDAICFTYDSDRWVEISRSNN